MSLPVGNMIVSSSIILGCSVTNSLIILWCENELFYKGKKIFLFFFKRGVHMHLWHPPWLRPCVSYSYFTYITTSKMFPLLKTMQKKRVLLVGKGGLPPASFFLFLFFSHQINKRIDRMICYAQQPAPQARKRKQTEIKAHQNKVCQRIELKCVLYCSCKLSRI